MRLKIRLSFPGGQCKLCGKHLGLLRRLTGNTLCSDEHEQEISADLRALAVARLEDAAEEPVHDESTVM
jgi:hypothetical protein